jgi:hypothetical protein
MKIMHHTIILAHLLQNPVDLTFELTQLRSPPARVFKMSIYIYTEKIAQSNLSRHSTEQHTVGFVTGQKLQRQEAKFLVVFAQPPLLAEVLSAFDQKAQCLQANPLGFSQRPPALGGWPGSG